MKHELQYETMNKVQVGYFVELPTLWSKIHGFSHLTLCLKNSSCFKMDSPLTAQFAVKPTRGQSSHRLDNSQTCQLADYKFLKIMELHHICTLNPALSVTLTPSIIASAQRV